MISYPISLRQKDLMRPFEQFGPLKDIYHPRDYYTGPIKKRCWSKAALEATAPGLEEKLGKLAPAYATAGFVQRFDFEKNCLVVQWSGDNPNSLAGLTLSTPSDLAISLEIGFTARLLNLVFICLSMKF